MLFNNVTCNVHLKILKPAMLEHTLYDINVTSSRIRNWFPQLTKVLIVQSPAFRASVQSQGSRAKGPEPSVQSPASRVQRPKSSVQSPVSNTRVQSPGILVCPLAETDVSISKIHDNSLLSECIIVIYCIVSGN